MVTFEPSGEAGGAVSVPVPYLISWNITKRCNLNCSHCYLDAKEMDGAGDISTEDAKSS